MGREGCSRHEIAAKIDIDMNTFRLWQKQNPEFLSSVTRAMELCQAWWEASGRLATFRSEGFNATSYIFNMTNHFGADWKHKAEQINVHEAGDSFAALLGSLTQNVCPKADDEGQP